MTDKRDLSLTSVRIDEENGKYRFTVFPLLHRDESIILSWEKSGDEILKEWTSSEEMAGNLVIEKEALQEQPYAYLVRKRGSNRGEPLRILTRTPDVRQILLMPDGRIKISVAVQDDYTASAGLLIEVFVGEKEQAAVHLHQGRREFDLAQAGLATTQRESIGLRIRFYTEDDDHNRVTGAQTEAELVLNPPEIIRVVREESRIILGLSEEPKQPLYARICQNGSPLYTMPCERDTLHGDGGNGGQEAVDYAISTQLLNLTEDACSVEIACRSAWAFSYWSEPAPVLMKRPTIGKIQAEPEGRTIWMGECGYYCWQGKYERTDRIIVEDRKIPEIRYADRYGSVTVLSPPAIIPDKVENYFYFDLEKERYCLTEAEMVCQLREKYEKEYLEGPFQLKIEKDKGASLYILIEKNNLGTMKEDFKKLLEEVCQSYEQLEELTGCFGHMPLKPGDMLGVRYGYDTGEGYCDLHAGMELCFDYEQYQSIPELKPRKREEANEEADLELSGFTGNGSSIFPCVLRGGRITFEPFAWGMHQDMRCRQANAKAGKCGMIIDAPTIGDDRKRIGMAAGIWDALFERFPKPFVRLLCPQDWERSEHTNQGSVYYFKNICLIAACSYQELMTATDRYYENAEMLGSVYHICFRGRTAIRIMIHIFVEGHPQTCALGTTLGDISAAYGLGGRVRLERFCEGRYVSFADVGMDIPLYIGDRICSV